MTLKRARLARAMYDPGNHTVQEIADTFAVSRPTIYGHLGGDAAPPGDTRGAETRAAGGGTP